VLTLTAKGGGGIGVFAVDAGDVADSVVGGGKVGAGEFVLASLAAGDCAGGVSSVVVVCATDDDVSDRQAVKVERSGIA
jgi:hypothetical protein